MKAGLHTVFYVIVGFCRQIFVVCGTAPAETCPGKAHGIASQEAEAFTMAIWDLVSC